jgi:hypothetical protein
MKLNYSLFNDDCPTNIEELFASGSEINAPGNNGKTSLHIACRDGFLLIAEFLVQVTKLDFKSQRF